MEKGRGLLWWLVAFEAGLIFAVVLLWLLAKSGAVSALGVVGVVAIVYGLPGAVAGVALGAVLLSWVLLFRLLRRGHKK